MFLLRLQKVDFLVSILTELLKLPSGHCVQKSLSSAYTVFTGEPQGLKVNL